MGIITGTLQSKIQDALKAGETTKVSTYRMLLAALNNEQIAKQHDLSEDEEIAVIKRQLKQREEAVDAYTGAGRTEQAAQEKEEAVLLKEFLPEQMGQEELVNIVNKVIEEMGDTKDFGSVMKEVMAKTQGKADGKVVSEIVRGKLS